MEYSNSKGTWHEESSGMIYMQGDQLVVTGGGMMQLSVYNLTENEMTIEFMEQEDKGTVIVQKYHHDTFKRIS